MLLFKNKLFTFLVLTCLLLAVFFYPSDWMGWFVFGGGFYFLDRMKLDNKIKVTLLIILLIHQLFALYFFLKYKGYVDGVDFTAFNITARTIAEGNYFSFGTDALLFSNLLALVYKINNSQLFGQEIAVMFFMSSCFVFMRIIGYYKLNNYLITILLFYALMPAALLWTSVILREPLEMTFLMLAFECLLYFKFSNLPISKRLLYLSCAALLIFYMCLLHKALFLSLPPFFVMALILPLKRDNDERVTLASMNLKVTICNVCVAFIPLCLLLGILLSNGSNSWVLKKEHKGLMLYTSNLTVNMVKDLSSQVPNLGIYGTLSIYRYGYPGKEFLPLEANTNYDKGIFTPKNLIEFGYMSIMEYALYAFFPALLVTGKWSLLNVVLSFIYALRSIFFCSAIYFCLIQYKQKVYSPIMLMVLYFLVGYVFALGTISYGTAMRHNLMTDWIILLLGTPLLHNFFYGLYKRTSWKNYSYKMIRRVSV